MSFLAFRTLVHGAVQYGAFALIALLVIRIAVPPNRFRYGTGSLLFRLGRATDWLVLPIQSALPPGTSLAVGPILAIVAALLLSYFGLALIDDVLGSLAGFFAALSRGAVIPAIGFLAYGAVSVFVALLVLRIIFSWIRIGYNAGGRVTRFVYDVTEPALAIFRGIIPPLGMFDLSPIILFFLLQFLKNAIRSLLIGG
ncbi:MAG: YggT family protein [Candidatus Eisenbacteria bacterium]